MSKAFTRESDDEAPELAMRPFSIPGGKNYLTPTGAQRLRDELEHLVRNASAARDAALPETRQENPPAQQRVQYLQQSLAAAVEVTPPSPPWEKVLFGATVRLRDGAGPESTYRIVGLDETDLDRNWISWLSPIAKALLKTRLGQRVKIRTPAGEHEWEVTGIAYE